MVNKGYIEIEPFARYAIFANSGETKLTERGKADEILPIAKQLKSEGRTMEIMGYFVYDLAAYETPFRETRKVSIKELEEIVSKNGVHEPRRFATKPYVNV